MTAVDACPELRTFTRPATGPMVVWLWTRLDQLPADDFFGVWVRVLILLNTISLVIDTVGVVRYAAGDRSDMCSPST